jgi:hypothetical protein
MAILPDADLEQRGTASVPAEGPALSFAEMQAAKDAQIKLDEAEAEHEAELARIVASHWKGDPIAGNSRVQNRHTSRWVLGIVGGLILIGVVVGPLILDGRLAQNGSSVVSDLTQFSKFEQGQKANSVAVAQVEHNARETISGGATVWAERSGNKCWGVVVSGGSASAPELQASSLC